jgi:sugar phosphate isomerase/epimerase
MQIGIFAKTFPGSDPLTVLQAARDAGYASVQYNFACSDLPSMPDTVPEAAVVAIASAMRETGVAIVALSATYNMIHPDLAVRETGLRRLDIACGVAAHLGIPLVTLCTGTRDAEDQWRHHPNNETPAAWADLVSEMGKAATIAERHGVALGIEPEQANVVRDAGDALRLFDEVPSPTLKIVLDPANLFEEASADEARRIVADAISRLGPRIGLAHAKDRDANGRFVTVGSGIVDFPAMVAALRAAGYSGALVTHGLSAAEAPGVARFLIDCVG